MQIRQVDQSVLADAGVNPEVAPSWNFHIDDVGRAEDISHGRLGAGCFTRRRDGRRLRGFGRRRDGFGRRLGKADRRNGQGQPAHEHSILEL